MSTQLQLRRGTTAEHASFTGAVGETTVDTTKDSLVVHDGTTAGGIPIAKSSDITLGTLSVTADAAELNKLDGATASTAELNHVTGVTSNIQTQLGTLTTGLGNVNTDLVNDTTPQLGGDLDLNGNSILGLNSSNLSADFTVAAGKTVVAGTVANLFNGEIGTNPEANTLGTEQSYSAETFNYITGDGNTIVKAYSNASGHHYVKTIKTSDGTVISDIAVYTGQTGAGTSITQVSSNRFVVYGSYQSGNFSGNYSSSCGSSSTGLMYNSSAYAVLVEISATGVVTYGNAWTDVNNNQRYSSTSISIYPIDGDITNRCGLRWGEGWYCKNGNNVNVDWSWYYYTFNINGSLNITSEWQTTDSFITSLSGAIRNTAGTKLLKPSTSTSWNISDWNGIDVSNGTTITNNRTNITSVQVIKPDPTTDKLLCFYINTNLELCVETLNWTSSSIDVVANSKWIVEADASGVSLGAIKGSTDGVGITYENGSKGRFKSLSLDSNMIVTGASSLMTVNVSNVVPALTYKGSDKFQAWNNNVDTYTNEITVNAYSTSPLKPLGVITANGTGGDTVSVTTNGVAGGFTGLTVDSKYYYDTSVFDGTVTLTNTGTHVGRAVSTTEILLTDLTEQ